MEIARAFAMFDAAYGKKWEVRPFALEAWTEIMWDLEPEEMRAAVTSWCASEKWPPAPADIRNMVPRLCRCGRCSACHRRAVQRAMKAGPGADLDTPIDNMDERRRQFFQPALDRAREQRMLGP